MKHRLNPGGFCVATAYGLIVVFVYALTAAFTKPSNVGYDWIPFILLAAPWFWVDHRWLIPGVIVNTAAMYLFGVLLHALWRRIVKQPAMS